MADDVTLRIGGSSEEWRKAVLEGGATFGDFVKKVAADSAALDSKLREFSGVDTLAKAEQYREAVTRIGGASRLTADEKTRLNGILGQALEKYQALGQQAPEAMRKLHEETAQIPPQVGLIRSGIQQLGPMIAATFAVAAVSRTVGSFIDLTGRLTDLKAQTGLSTTALQLLGHVGDQSGVSMDAMAKAALDLGRKLAGGDASAASAVRALGLDVGQLLAMSPEERFFTVADAVGAIADSAQKASIADNFGKSWLQVLPALDGRARELADSFKRMGLVIDEDVVAKGDELGDQWTVLKATGGALIASVLSPFVPLMANVATMLTQAVVAATPLLRWAIDAFTPFSKITASLESWAFALEVVGLRAQALPKPLGDAALGVEAWRKAAADRAAVPLSGALKDEDRITAELTESVQRSTKAHEEAEKRVSSLYDRLSGADARQSLRDLQSAWSRLGAEQRQHPEVVARLVAEYDKLRDQLRPGALPKDLEQLWLKAQAHFESKKTVEFFDIFKLDTSKPVPVPPIEFGFEGKKTVSFFDIFPIDKNPPKGVPPGVRDTVTDIGRQLPGLIQQAFTGGGGWQGAMQAGGSLAGQKLMEGIFGKPGGESGLLKGMTGFLGQTLGAAVPIIGSLAGPLISKLTGLFKSEGKETNDLRDKFVAAAGGIHELNVKAQASGLTLDRLLGAKKVKDFQAAVDELNAAFGKTEADTALAKQAMEEWGISAQEAGQKFAQAAMDERANDMLAKLKAATAAGVDMSAIVRQGGDDFGAMVHQAIRTGTTISREFEPVIRLMIEQGTLIDENGDKFTDLGQIPWAEDIGGAVRDLSGAIRELKDVFVGGLPGAFQSAETSGVAFSQRVRGETASLGGTFTDLRNRVNSVDWRGMANEAVDALRDVQDEVDAVSFGHSPGGLKEYPLLLARAQRSIKDWRRDWVSEMQAVQDRVDTMGVRSLTSRDAMFAGLGSARMAVSDTALRTPAAPAAAAPVTAEVAVYVALDPSTGRIRRLDQGEFGPHVLQQWLDEGRVRVPARMISQRAG